MESVGLKRTEEWSRHATKKKVRVQKCQLTYMSASLCTKGDILLTVLLRYNYHKAGCA